jgi:hypothetical protein
MGLDEVVDAVETVESLLADGETGPVQDSLSWQQADADVQLGKACAMLGTCRQLRRGTNDYVSIVELSFNAVERSFQFYLLDQTAAESSDFRSHEQLFEDIEGRGVFSDTGVRAGSTRSVRNTGLGFTTTSTDRVVTWRPVCTS